MEQKHKKDKSEKEKVDKDAPMQYSKFLKGVYDSSSDEEVPIPSIIVILSRACTLIPNNKICIDDILRLV
jgi:hypothetical protein